VEKNIVINSLLIFAAIFDLILGFVVIKKGTERESSIVFGITCLAVALWTIGIAMFRLNDSLAPALFWNREFIFAAFIIATTFLHFSFVFTKKKLSLSGKLLIHLPSLFILTALFLPDVFIKGIAFQAWGKESLIGYAYPIYGILFTFYMVAVYFNLLRAYYSSKGEFKLRILFVFLAISISVLFGSFFNLYLILLGNYRFIWVGPYASFIFVAMTAYAITKSSFLNTRVVIGKAFAHILTIIVLGSIYLLLMSLYIYIFSDKLDWKFVLVSIAYGIWVGEFFQKIRQNIQTPVDRFFVKAQYNFPDVTRIIATKFRQSLTHPDIIKNIYPILSDTVDIQSIRFFFVESYSERLVEWDTKKLEPIPESIILNDDPIIGQVISKNDIVNMADQLAIPSLSEGKVLALVIIGKKRSEDEYTRQDFDLFKTISEYIGIALEYIIKPYEEVQKQFEQSERKLIDAEKVLYRSQRLASLGTLTAGVTHEIRNPLGVIRSGLELLPKKPRDSEYLDNFRDKYVRHVDRIENIVEKVLGLARDEKTKSEKMIDLNPIIEETIPLAHTNELINIKKDLQTIPAIKGVSEDIERVFINLMENAGHAMKDGGTLSIKTYSEKVEDDPLIKVVVELSDTGTGIPKENIEKIFDPFYSSRHEGTGLGLSITYRIVKEHGADISVKSVVGAGTTFRLSFNAAV